MFKSSSEPHLASAIAEDVPELVANTDRKGLSAMDFAALAVPILQELWRKVNIIETQLAVVI